jgi:Flp pilus assembly protein TadG
MTLLLPLLCLLLFGTLDVARYIRVHAELDHAAHDGLMIAQNSYYVAPSGTSTPVTQATVTAAIQNADPDATVVPMASPQATVAPGTTYTVVVKAGYKPIAPFVATLKGLQSVTVSTSGITMP